MKIHFWCTTAFERLSGSDDVKSRYVFLRFSRLWNERKCAFCTLPLIIFSAIKSNLNGVHLNSGSWPISFSFGRVKEFDALRISA